MTTDIHSSRGSRSGYWLLQFASRESVDYIYRGYSQRWQARKEMQAGDGVVLWKPGKEAGVFGLGKIISGPAKRRFLTFEISVEWECTHKSKGVLLRYELRKRNDPELNKLLAVRGFLKSGVERVSESQWRRMSQLVTQDKSPAPETRVYVKDVPVEDPTKETAEAYRRLASRKVLLREHSLVNSYVKHMKAKGVQFRGRRICPAGESTYIRCDLYEPKRGVLFEAKGLPTREAIRMAIGELRDYGRFIKPLRSLAVLLPERPSNDLEKLLTGQQIKLVWQTKNGFADNVKGQLS